MILEKTVIMGDLVNILVIIHHPPTISSSIKEYTILALAGSLFDVGVGDGNSGVGPRTTHLTYRKVDF